MRPWTRILGIDPGFRITGYGVIESNGQESRYVSSGIVEPLKVDNPSERLKIIFDGIRNIIGEFQPNELSIEKVFMHRNADSAIKLGQARAAAICASFDAEVVVYEYAAREVKKAIVGKGAAQKDQVQHMVRILLNYSEPLSSDASDALGIALCHAHFRSSALNLAEVMG
ncbi:MAG: crossover junction endodeoxyribonuclease RuvC [Pseudomonadota bacterium]|nr:crossover junction endodeoxyribonuclease RuvC [Pseudomonadota bacterium]